MTRTLNRPRTISKTSVIKSFPIYQQRLQGFGMEERGSHSVYQHRYARSSPHSQMASSRIGPQHRRQGSCEGFQASSEGLPRLDAYLAAQTTDPKHLEGEFGVTAQAFVERSHALGVLPSGRALLGLLSRRFRVDKVRGATVSQQTLLALNLEGYSQGKLQAFREKVEFCLNEFSPEDWPAESTMFAWLYGKLKHCRLMSCSIDKIRDSNPGSAKRTCQWLWGQLVELFDELREEANEESIRDVLIKPRSTATPAPKHVRNLLQIPFPHLLPRQLPLRQSQKRKRRKVKARVGKGRRDGKGKGTREKPKAPPPKAKAKEGKSREFAQQGDRGKPPAPKGQGPLLVLRQRSLQPRGELLVLARTSRKGPCAAAKGPWDHCCCKELCCHPRPAAPRFGKGLSGCWHVHSEGVHRVNVASICE